MAHVLSDIIEEDEEEEEEGPMPFTVAHHHRGIKIILAEFTVVHYTVSGTNTLFYNAVAISVHNTSSFSVYMEYEYCIKI